MIAALHDTLGWSLALTLCLPGLRGRPLRVLGSLILVALALRLPVAGSTPIEALRGLFAGLSVPTVVVLAALLAARAGVGAILPRGERIVIAALVAVTGTLFYPLALGLGPVDPYAWGYGGAILPLLAGGLALGAWFAGLPVVAAAIAVALLGWRLQWLASPNLWDYLVDPLLAFGGLLALFAMAVRRLWRVVRKPTADASTAR